MKKPICVLGHYSLEECRRDVRKEGWMSRSKTSVSTASTLPESQEGSPLCGCGCGDLYGEQSHD